MSDRIWTEENLAAARAAFPTQPRGWIDAHSPADEEFVRTRAVKISDLSARAHTDYNISFYNYVQQDRARQGMASSYWFHTGQVPPQDASIEDLRAMVNFVQWKQLLKRVDEELEHQRDEAVQAGNAARLEVERLSGALEALLKVKP